MFFWRARPATVMGIWHDEALNDPLSVLQIDQLDLIQFHNLAQDADWNTVMAAGGALEAAKQAQKEGLVKFIGITGHGTRIAEMHLKSLARYDFASVLLPYYHLMMQDDQYKAEFEALYKLCADKGIAVQTIKAIAKRRWREDDPSPKFSWYEPYRDEDVIERAVHFVLRRERLFLNSTSDASLLPRIFAAAESFNEGVAENLDDLVAEDNASEGESLFVRGVSDDVRL